MKVDWSRQGELLQAKVDQLTDIEQLWVDGRQQILARYPDFNPEGGHWQGHAPDAISAEKVAGWSHPAGGFVHAMHAGEWGDMHFVITGVDEQGELTLEGGHQNNRPSGLHQTYRMVENIREELTAPGEFWFDPVEKLLYWYPDSSGVNTPSFIEVPVVKELLRIAGSEQKLVSDIRISGLTFSQSRRTFMEPYEPLLRSDWTIYRGGAVVLERAENCRIEGCRFEALGGNGIFVSGQARELEIRGNLIHDIGGSGICFVGLPSAVRSPAFQYGQFVHVAEMDTVRGPLTEDYPADCIVDNNLIYRTGRIEKQTAGVQISMAMNIRVSHNSIYDVPRAGINISEGTWGGHLIEYNDVFMTVQESGDHGSFNSWGRDRFWHPNRGVMDSLTLADPQMPLWDAIHTTVIRNNRFRCDHGWDIDLDDGSTNYEIYNNLCLNGGIKLREGFYRKVENNIMINNGFHPHVWFVNSEDIFRRNIVMTRHQDIRLDGWGQEVDENLFPTAEALKAAQANGTDQHSKFGNPLFMDPGKGDFNVRPGSPALDLGFENFDQDHFGVQDEALKELRKEPQIPELYIAEFTGIEKRESDWLGARIKNIETLAERSASGLPDESGVIILEVTPGTLAAKSGLQKGDVVIKAEGSNIKNKDELFQAQQARQWTGQLSITVIRNQQPTPLTIALK